MRSDTRLQFAVFQLTPTRTRCDLVIMANGKSEKIASGLVNPFLSHLKTAQDQISKGGYSIKLEPDSATEVAWFTKDTVERFVRFVSTPEVLERVDTIQSEILQIEEAILYQGNDSVGLSTVEDHHLIRSNEITEVSRSMLDADGEKAIVLYKSGSHPNLPESNGSKEHENSKVQLLRVLESRKNILQKEQAMAFARAAAAGFDTEKMPDLISFAESFGAMRLMEASIRYMQLWKDKHETGQWIEVEAAEALSFRSELSLLNIPGIIRSGDDVKQKEILEALSVSGGEISMDTKSNPSNLGNAGDKRLSSDPQVPSDQSEYYQGHIQHPSFPQWAMHAPPGSHVFQPCPLQAMPYYQNYPVNGQFFHSPPPPMQGPSFTHQRKGNKKHSRHSKYSTSISEHTQSTSESEEEPSRCSNSLQKAGRSGKKKGIVVIRNLNYIAGRGYETLGNESEPAPVSELEEAKELHSDNGERKHKPLGSSKRKDIYAKSLENPSMHGGDEQLHLQETDAGNWQAFQNFLLKAEEKLANALDQDVINSEKEFTVKKGQNKGEHDSILLPKRDHGNYHEVAIMEYDAIRCKGNRTKPVGSTDGFLASREGNCLQDIQTDTHFREIEGLSAAYKKSQEENFLMNVRNSEKSSSRYVSDESFVVPFRSGSQDQLGTDSRLTMYVDPNLPSASQGNKDSFDEAKTIVVYVPDDLNLMPERTKENESIGYDPAMDCDILASLVIKKERKEQDYILSTATEDSMKADKEKGLKPSHGELEKKGKDSMIRNMTSSRSTMLNEAQKRAEKIRNYKADLQQLKKEQEEKEIRRLEDLKRERQKRIAARRDTCSTRSSASLQQKQSRLPVNDSASAFKSSKFVDSKLGSNSPLPNLPGRKTSIGSIDSDKAIETSISNKSSRLASSLPELKSEVEKQESSARIRRLSEPQRCNLHSIPGKSAISNQLMKTVAVEPQSKKIFAIMQLDRTKSESLPELKIKPYRTPSEPSQSKSAAKQQKGARSRTLIDEYTDTQNIADNATILSYSDENLVIEKTVLMLENNVVPAHVQTLDGKIDEMNSYRDTNGDMAGVDTACAAIRAPPSPIDRGRIEHAAEGNQDDQRHPCEHMYEIERDFSKDETQKFSVPAVNQKACCAPFARRSSEEHATDSKPDDQMHEAPKKPRDKESKGFRNLWKFGKKDHTFVSGDSNHHSDRTVVDDHHGVATSNDISTLKNLISQDETHITGTPTKVSRPFSILSPFRGMSKEKKIAA